MNYYGQRADGTPLTTQRETVLYYLKEAKGRKITSGLVWNEFGFSRLSAIVFDLEKIEGVKLERKLVDVKNRYGGTCRVMQYWLPDRYYAEA